MEWWLWEIVKWSASIGLTLLYVLITILKPDWFDVVAEAPY